MSKYKSKLVVWEYFEYRKDKRLFVLEDWHSSQKLWSQSGCKNTSNMFTYISEQHPSLQIQLCLIYNLRLQSYDFRDAEWIPESSRDNEFTMQRWHKTLGLMNKSKTELSNHYMV